MKSQRQRCEQKPACRGTKEEILPPESQTLWGIKQSKTNQLNKSEQTQIKRGSEDRREWKAGDQAQLAYSEQANISQLQDKLCSSKTFTLVSSFSSQQHCTADKISPILQTKKPSWDIVGLGPGPYMLIQMGIHMWCLWYIQKTKRIKLEEV